MYLKKKIYCTSFQIEEKILEVFLFLFFVFSSLIRNYSIKIPGFYTLQIARIFSSEYSDLHKLTCA